MKNEEINWDEVPDILSKEQIYKLCHISKETARFLLKSGLLPCKYSGKKTRCYQVARADVQAYMKEREKHPEKYMAPSGYYKGLCTHPHPRPALSELQPNYHDLIQLFYHLQQILEYRMIVILHLMI